MRCPPLPPEGASAAALFGPRGPARPTAPPNWCAHSVDGLTRCNRGCADDVSPCRSLSANVRIRHFCMRRCSCRDCMSIPLSHTRFHFYRARQRCDAETNALSPRTVRVCVQAPRLAQKEKQHTSQRAVCDAAAAAAAFPSRENLNRRRLRNGGARPSYRVSRPKSMVTWTSGGTGGLRAYLLPPYMYGTARGGGWGAVCRRHCGPDGRREGASLTGVQQNGCGACVRVWMSVLVQNALALREQPVDDVPVRLCNGKGQARARDVGRENCAF